MLAIVFQLGCNVLENSSNPLGSLSNPRGFRLDRSEGWHANLFHPLPHPLVLYLLRVMVRYDSPHPYNSHIYL